MLELGVDPTPPVTPLMIGAGEPALFATGRRPLRPSRLARRGW